MKKNLTSLVALGVLAGLVVSTDAMRVGGYTDKNLAEGGYASQDLLSGGYVSKDDIFGSNGGPFYEPLNTHGGP